MATYGYTYIYRENGFPNSIMNQVEYRDVYDEIGDKINQINTYRNQGDYESAKKLIESNSDKLKEVSIGASLINSLIEENRNAQLYALEASQEIYTTSEEPIVSSTNVIWIGDE